jgi:hypothetical protein
MLWVPLQLAAAYACAYPFGRKDPAGNLPAATAFLVAVDTVEATEIETRRAECTYAAGNRFGANAVCAYNANLGAFWAGFAERCAACDATAVADAGVGESYFPAQCTNDADPGADAYAIDYAPAVTNRTRLAMKLGMPVMAETADFLDILCRDQCSLHLTCTDYLATNTRTCLLLGDLTPGHMDSKTTTTTATTTPASTTTQSTTATTTSDICRHDACANGYNQCRYVDANGQVQCSHGSWQYDCELREGFDVFYCSSTLMDDGSYVQVPVLVTPPPPGTTTPPFLQDFEAASIPAGTQVQHREIKRKATAYSAPFLRWAAMTPARFKALSALEVEGELTVFACATACESDPDCVSAVWGGTNEGCRYWAPPEGPQQSPTPTTIPFDELNWDPSADTVVPVVFSEQQSTATPRFWYDPFVDEQGCTYAGCPSLCQNTAHTHVRVVTLPSGAADAVYTVNIQNCAHLQELHFVPAARLTPESLTNCTALRKVVFFDTVEPGNGPPPLTSCAVAPRLVIETTIVPEPCPEGLEVFDDFSRCEHTAWPTLITKDWLCTAATEEFRCCYATGPGAGEDHISRCQANFDGVEDLKQCGDIIFQPQFTNLGYELYSTSCPPPPTETGTFKKIKPQIRGTFTAFPTAQQWNTVAPDTGPDTADLSGNLIRRIRDDALDDYPFGGLKHVDASHNLISTVGERAFSNVAASLETVDLSHNWITFLADTAFKDCTRLTSLNLNTNRITTLTHALLEFSGSVLTALDIRNNYATGLRAHTGDGAPGFLEYDVDKICNGFNNACNSCPHQDHFVCGDDPGALYPAAIPQRFLGLEVDTAQIPAPDTGSSTAVWCIPCDGDKLAALNPDGRASLGEAITGVTRLFWTECPEITRATTADVGYDLATDANGNFVQPEQTALLAPTAPQLEQFSTSRDLRDRAFVLGYSAGTVFPENTGATTTVLLTRCDTRALVVLGDQPSRTSAFLGCPARELYVEPPATAVGAFTFARMANLRRVSLPQTLVAIDPDAFAGSDRIIDLVVPAATTADVNPALAAALKPAGCTTRGETKLDEELGFRFTALATTGAPCSDGFTLVLVSFDDNAANDVTQCIHWNTLDFDNDATFCDMAVGDYVCCTEGECKTAAAIAGCPETVGQVLVGTGNVVTKRCAPLALSTTPAETQCTGPLCGGPRDDTELYGICGCQRDAPGCFPSPGQQTALQVANATSPACGPEPVPAMGPLYKAPDNTLFYQPGMVPVEVTAKDATAPATMLAPIGRLHELCTGEGARGLATLPPPSPPPTGLGAGVDNARQAPQLPVEMSRAADAAEGLPAYAVALVAIGGVGVVLGAARLLRIV